MSDNNIDEVMDKYPPLNEEDLDKVIAYHRKQRAMRESGVKTRPKKDTGPVEGLDQLRAALMKNKPNQPTMIKRRV